MRFWGRVLLSEYRISVEVNEVFIDFAKIFVRGGDGGNGCISFRHEKYVPAGGPDGGDGGNGGNVILEADNGLSTLMDYKYKRHYSARRGGHGKGKNMHGRNGEDVILRVPAGTLLKDAQTGIVLADLVCNRQRVVVARGGKGGKGNARFASPTRQAPRIAGDGKPGEERWLVLELKLLADVGLVGFPNAGKSTLISRVSAARPKIAPYPFTTLAPNLGVVNLEDSTSFVIADLPGLIEGAHGGSGLGHEFLRHIERTKVLVHIVDLSCEDRDPLSDFEVIDKELKLYNEELASKPRIVAANKIDIPGTEGVLEKFVAALRERGMAVYPISALTGEGIKELLWAIARELLMGSQSLK